MFAHQLTTALIPHLQPTDTIQKALDWMSELHLPHLAVVENQKYLGIVIEDILLDCEDPFAILSSLQATFKQLSCNTQQHILDVIDVITQNKLACLAVVDQENNYVGVITQHYLLEQFAQLSGIHEQGAILAITMGLHDYNLPEIARIVANDDAKILMHFTTIEAAQITVTLKVNKHNCTSLIASFERYNYSITYHKSINEADDVLQERLQSLLKYLEI